MALFLLRCHRPIVTLVPLALLAIVLAGCHPSVDGKYRDPSGTMTIDLTAGKATIMSPLGSFNTDYKVDGNKVTLKYQGEELVLTRADDGSLQGPLGTYSKVKE